MYFCILKSIMGCNQSKNNKVEVESKNDDITPKIYQNLPYPNESVSAISERKSGKSMSFLTEFFLVRIFYLTLF